MALQYSELSQCYTHHIELLHFTLKCPEITNDLRYRVMDMWLIESDGDIAPLLKLDCHSVVRHCLLVHATRCFSYPTLYLPTLPTLERFCVSFKFTLLSRLRLTFKRRL